MAVNGAAPAVSIVGYRLVPPDQLLAHPLNARRHPAAQRESLRASLRALGWIAPVVVNLTTGHVVDGHARVEEALSAGAAVVPVVEVELTPEQEALALAVYDPITSQAMYDREALDNLLRDVSTDEQALQALLADVAQSAGLEYGATGDLADVPAQLDRAAELQAIWGTERGQLWTIPSATVPGQAHRLLCGDSTDAGDVARLMDGRAAAITVTSPPYGVGKDYEQGGYDGWAALMRDVLPSIVLCSPLAAINLGDVKVGADHRELHTYGDLVRVCANAGLPLIGTRIWLKGAAWAGQGPYWLSGYRAVDEFEYIGLFGATTYSERTTEDWRYRGVWDIPSVRSNDVHSAGFPVELPRRLLVLLTDPGALAFEPFLGSASTMLAAEATGRLCYGLELEPKYVAVALQRLADLGLHPERG